MKKLFVRNLSFNSREDDVRSLSEQYGSVGLHLDTDRDHWPEPWLRICGLQVVPKPKQPSIG